MGARIVLDSRGRRLSGNRHHQPVTELGTGHRRVRLVEALSNLTAVQRKLLGLDPDQDVSA